MDSCEHHIPIVKACPWCKRPAQKENYFSTIKTYFQFYQIEFNNFVNRFAHKSRGPAATTYIVQDLNGEIYWEFQGPRDVVVKNLKAVLSRIEKEGQNATASN